jgi:cysteine synthase B
VYAVEPPSGELVEGLRSLDDGYIPPVYEKWGGSELLDGKSIVRPKESLVWTRRLVTDCGIFAGISSGGALAGVIKKIESGDITAGNTVVFVVADGGWKYLSTGAWTDDIDEVVKKAEKIIYF